MRARDIDAAYEADVLQWWRRRLETRGAEMTPGLERAIIKVYRRMVAEGVSEREAFNSCVVENCCETVERIAKSDQIEGGRLRRFRKEERQAVIDAAQDALLRPRGNGVENVLSELLNWSEAQRVVWLASDKYPSAYRLAAQAVNSARKAYITALRRRGAEPEANTPAPNVIDDAALDAAEGNVSWSDRVIALARKCRQPFTEREEHIYRLLAADISARDLHCATRLGKRGEKPKVTELREQLQSQGFLPLLSGVDRFREIPALLEKVRCLPGLEDLVLELIRRDPVAKPLKQDGPEPEDYAFRKWPDGALYEQKGALSAIDAELAELLSGNP